MNLITALLVIALFAVWWWVKGQHIRNECEPAPLARPHERESIASIIAHEELEKGWYQLEEPQLEDERVFMQVPDVPARKELHNDFTDTPLFG